MKNKTLSIVVGVLIGLAVFFLVGSAISLLSEFFLIDDLINSDATDGTLELMTDAKWAAFSVSLVTFVTIVGIITALIAHKKAFSIVASVLSFVLFVTAIVFIALIRKDAQYIGTNGYATGLGYISEMLQVAVSGIVTGVYFLLYSILHKDKTNSKFDKSSGMNTDALTGGTGNEKI